MYHYLDHKLRLDELTAAKTFHQATKAVEFLHSKNIIHRDLRLEQMLFTTTRRTKIKLTDLMHSTKLERGFPKTDTTKPTVFLFTAPEALKTGTWSKMSDIWSLGCCLFEMLYGYPPFTGEDKPLVRRILHDPVNLHPIWHDVSNEAMDLLHHLLPKDPFKRIKIKQAVLHRWFLDSVDIAALQKMRGKERAKIIRDQVEEFKERWHVGLDDADGRPSKEAAHTQAAILQRGQYSRSLTGTFSSLAASTRSSLETESLPSIDIEIEGEDWEVPAGRSDLTSHDLSLDTRPSTATYEDTEDDWDELDEEFFDQDAADSSLWSEAEFSDWTANSQEKKQLDKDFGGLSDSEPSEGSEGSDEGGEAKESGSALSRSSDGWGKKDSAQTGSSSSWGKVKKKPPGEGGESGSAIASSEESGWSSLKGESKSKDKSEGGSSQWSEDWSASEGAGEGTGRSSKSSGSQSKGKKKSDKGKKQRLAAIDENQAGAGRGESIGEVTNRSLKGDPVAPWDDPGEGNPTGAGSIIVMSRRSTSSSSGGDGTVRSEFDLAQQRSQRSAASNLPGSKASKSSKKK